ncbi:hypothetical protein VFPPC_14625 [Pochonia chlamydosporia 170]|uniref:Uncharacterized protein n=1 Tax=Pochonia chlamydosporia 170 TaxID=1380566 RepID=A0A179F8M8_METCM|nr:hypothetical protein VFPPC_14625 [Pochonia chlamydosporia 170]OAQ61782.1 hypothetical protein VFPPC_14625 [Pochonia chlamydosporia 170]
MAVNIFNPSNASASPFDIYNDAGNPLPPASPSLPNGCCNFVDLTPGANGAKCGCRRFWPRQTIVSPIAEQAGWCMCAHHACYHDDGPHNPRDGLQQLQQLPQQTNLGHVGQENERPRTGREPLSPVVDVSMQGLSTVPGMDFAAFSPGLPLSFVHEFATESEDAHNNDATLHPPGSMPDTLAWEEYIQSPPEHPRPLEPSEHSALPHLPSQFLMPSQTASTTSSIQAKYQRPFAGKGLGTLNNITPKGPASSHAQQPQKCDVKPLHVQRQDPATDSFVLVGHDGQGEETPRPDTATQNEPRVAAAFHGFSRETLQNLSDTISGHEQRLDRLETVSFSANGHDECVDKHDHMDLRVTELELRMEGVEKAVEVTGTANKDAEVEDDGAKSVFSAVTSVSSRPNPEEIMSQIDSLRAQVSHLQSFLPSHGHAWTVEVVFLPFPLKRLWQELSQFKHDATVSNDDWTQVPMTLSSATLRSQSPFGGDWAATDHDAEWLYPRACGDKSTQDRRLRSRGLIQTVSFRGPDARSVQAAIHEAFGSVFRSLGITPRHQPTDPRFGRYLGLQESWVPLRKIHKDSRLRFLNAAEMLTPSLWDVNFLHSVAMKAAEPRLFITHPDAYIQDYGAYESGWAWQRVREMDRVSLDVSESQEVKEADAMEHCWLWNEQLDEAPSIPTSLNMRQGRERLSTSPAVFPAPEQPYRSVSPFAVRGPSPMLSGRRAPRPPHIRTASVPIVPATAQSPSNASRRRIVSHGQSRHSSPFTRGPSSQGIQKRRRTRSPSYPHYTPRWTASPSPMPSAINDRQVTRGMTPLAYATPYSNAPLQELRPFRGSSVARSGTSHVPMEYATDELFDVEIYDSGSDESYREDADDESNSSGEIVTHVPVSSHDSHRRQLPEDEPWPGIEDQGRPSDGENIDPDEGEGKSSEASSQPSEYPSTQRAWPADNEMGFQIHEDEE